MDIAFLQRQPEGNDLIPVCSTEKSEREKLSQRSRQVHGENWKSRVRVALQKSGNAHDAGKPARIQEEGLEHLPSHTWRKPTLFMASSQTFSPQNQGHPSLVLMSLGLQCLGGGGSTGSEYTTGALAFPPSGCGSVHFSHWLSTCHVEF